MSKSIFVTTATGKTGSRITERLIRNGISVRRGSRSANPGFDWNDDSNWDAHLDGVSGAYIAYTPDIALPGAFERVQLFTHKALAKGVKRLVLLSGRGEEEAERAEVMLQATDADWTIVRASWFAQNFSDGFFAEDIVKGTVYFPRDGVVEPFVDADDIADVAAAAFMDDRHIGQLYELTGPRLITFREAFAEISAATGKPVTYVPVEIPDYIAALREANVPDDYVTLLGLLTTEVLDGRNTYTTDGVMRALGRPATDFSEFVRKAVAAGVWA